MRKKSFLREEGRERVGVGGREEVREWVRVRGVKGEAGKREKGTEKSEVESDSWA